MSQTNKIKLYFLIKKKVMEDISKSDIKEIATSRFPNLSQRDFDNAYSEAFSSI